MRNILQSFFVYLYTLPWNALALLLPLISVLDAVVMYVIKRVNIKSNMLWSLALVFWLIIILLATLHGRSAEIVSEGFQPLFQSYSDARSNPEIYRENFLNIVLFFPAGLFFQTLISDRWPKAISIIVPTFLLGVFSFIIEVIQLSFNLGLAEMDDILHNTIGALLGTIIAMAIMTLLNGHKTEKTK